jgi:hypothetical protein
MIRRLNKMTNTSIKAAMAMYQAGVEELISDNNGIMAFFGKKAAQALEMLTVTQSDAIRSGYLPDDARDFIAAIDDLCEDMTKNFEDMIGKITATTESVAGKVEAADGNFQRVEKEQIPMATPAPAIKPGI